ncbi:MAG: O-antigen ligase family protein [Lachnospiraceae bacterium]|nr:O-antigen ligase family protein [Lachnospiraceae bacterium]MDE6184361.1 O-antigen ligase family protein [Lachnospiraceae bacterium]
MYMKQGYVEIGEAKFLFFIYASLAALGILGLIGAIYGGQVLCGRIRRKEAYLIDWNGVSAVDLMVMLYATELFISYAFSDYRNEALWGTKGWYIGLVLLLTLCGLYFLISRLWGGERIVWYVGVAVSGIVFLIGILDRFSLYLIPLEVRDPAFISTLGNINWFCGYLSVLAPVGICLFLFQKQRRKLYGVYTVISFMAGFCQGGNSIFLFWGALFFILLWIAIKKREWAVDYFLLLFLWNFSAQLVRLIRLIVPGGYNYDMDNLCSYLTNSNFTLLVGAVVLGAYFFLHLKWKGRIDEREQRNAHKIMIFLLIGGILCFIAVTGFNTWRGIPGLSGRSSFLFSREWGNGRGAAIYSGLQMYGQMPVFHKLFGIGPDCFSMYAYSLPEVAGGLRDYFGANRLTNAHNELLTALVNTGVAGVCLFVGIFISFAKKCMKAGQQNPEQLIFAVCVICYFVHNMVSFAQVLNLPFLFLMLGMGERRQIMR